MNRVIERFARTWTYQRPAQGSLIKGRWEAGALGEPVEFRASIQPLRGLELLIQAEGERTKETVRIYTETQLQVANEAAKLKGDRVTWEGKVYEVQVQEAWDQTRIPFFKFKAVKIEQDTN